MADRLNYKGYAGSVDFSEEDGCFFGKVISVNGSGVGASITYEGATVSDLIEDFQGAIDDYLELVKEE